MFAYSNILFCGIINTFGIKVRNISIINWRHHSYIFIFSLYSYNLPQVICSQPFTENKK